MPVLVRAEQDGGRGDAAAQHYMEDDFWQNECWGGHKSEVGLYISILWSNNNCSNNFLRWFTNYQPSDDHCSLLLRISAIIPSMVKFDQDLGAQTSFLFSSKVASSSWPALLLDS